MAITPWNPATQTSRGNISLGIAPTIIDINAPELAEISSSTTIECAVTNFNASSSGDSQTVDWLCTPESEQIPGSTTHTMDDLMIKTSGQDDEDLIAALKIGDPIYIWRRDGVDTDTAPVAGDFVWVWRVIITSVDPVEAANTFIGINAHVSVLARVQVPVAIVA